MTKLKKMRKTKGFTQYELAKVAGVYPSTILNYETGKRLPDVGVAQKIATALGVTVSDIWPLPEEAA